VLAFFLRRLAASLLLLYLVLSVTFFLIHLAPGDPIHLSEDQRMTLEQRQRLQHLYRMDRPLPEQYLAWLSAVALHGDWGISFSQQRPVTAVIADFLPRTLLLGTAALVVEYAAALLFGIAAAWRSDGAADHAIRVVAVLLSTQPVFWLGLMSLLLFSYVWPIFPSGGHLALPALVLGLHSAGSTVRFVRGSLLEVMGRDFIRAARAKGLSEARVMWVHGLRNALTPLVQLFGLALPARLSGALIVEVVFSWPGIGWLVFNAVSTRDYPLLLGTTAFSSILVAVGSLVGDLAHAAADPRVRNA
jgi:ABC-type dipeptide/oligopeptide/nickel transport system permease component